FWSRECVWSASALPPGIVFRAPYAPVLGFPQRTAIFAPFMLPESSHLRSPAAHTTGVLTFPAPACAPAATAPPAAMSDEQTRTRASVNKAFLIPHLLGESVSESMIRCSRGDPKRQARAKRHGGPATAAGATAARTSPRRMRTPSRRLAPIAQSASH